MTIRSLEPNDPARSYADVFDALPIVAFTMSREGRITFISRAWEDFSGHTVADTLARSYQNFIVDEHRERAIAAWQRAFDAGLPYHDRYRVDLADGTTRWVLSQATPFNDEASSATGWFGTITDIDDRMRIEETLSESEATARAVAHAIPGVTWAASPAGDLTYVGDAWIEIHGAPVDVALGDAWLAAVHPDDRSRVGAVWMHSLQTGEPYKIEFRVRVADGSYRWFLVRAACVRNDAGAIVRWVGVNLDIEDKYVAEGERKLIESGLLLLSRTGAAVLDSLDVNRTLQNIARAFIDGFATYCIVDVPEPEGGWQRTVAHRQPELAVVLERLSRPGGNHPIARAIRSGESSVVSVDGRWVEEVSADATRRAAVASLHVRSVVIVPVITPAGEVVGALTCALDANEAREDYGPNDLRFVEEVGRRAGAAIANARLYERERRIAIELQAASLPETMPALDGVHLDAEYRPGSAEATIGGDWYDAFMLDDGRLAITLGDVLGHGLHAAVTMTKLRQAMQSAAMVDSDPNVMLTVADKTIRLADPDGYATAIAAIYDPRARTVTFASAGHPGPLLRSSDARVTAFESPGLMIGLRPGGETTTGTIAIPPASLLAFYTDGLVEATRNVDEGQERLRDALMDAAVRAAPHPARAIVAHVLGENTARDDIAVLVARFD